MNRQPHVSVIILNWNGFEDTKECIQSLKSIDYENKSVIVVDNNSRDDDVERLRNEYKDNIVLIENSENLGFAEGNNVGIRYAVKHLCPEYIFLLNNDATLKKDSLTQLVTRAEEHNGIAVFGPAITYDSDRSVVWSAGLEYKNKIRPFEQCYQDQPVSDLPDEPFETNKVIGAAFLIPIVPLLEVGLLAPDFFLYHEESEWCHRAKEKGFKCMVVPSARVYHKVSQSATTSPKIPSYYHSRNKILLAYKTMPLYFALPVALILAWRDIIGTLLNHVDRDIWRVLLGIYDGLLRNEARIIPE